MTKDTLNSNANLVVGYASPGWPLSSYPSGIVAYIQNVISGFDDQTQAIIFSRLLAGYKPNDNIVDLENFNITKRFHEKLIEKFFYRIKLSKAQSVIYQRDCLHQAKKLSLAVQASPLPLDIIEMEESFGFAQAFVSINKVPVVTRLHGPNFIVGAYNSSQEDINFKLRVLYEGKAIVKSHGITSPSMDVLQKVRDYYNIDLPGAKVIANPIVPVSAINQWQLSANSKLTILYVGRFESVKGGDLMLDAFRLIALQKKEVELVFVGPDRGVNLHGKLIGFDCYLERFIPESDVKSRIKFLGHCDSQTIAKLRTSSLITVFPSRYENFPVSLLEALATGCPTVATAVGGIKEIIVDNYNGLLAEPSAESIADKVLALIDDSEKMKLLSKNAIKDCTERFSPKVIAAQTIDYYRSVLAKR